MRLFFIFRLLDFFFLLSITGCRIVGAVTTEHITLCMQCVSVQRPHWEYFFLLSLRTLARELELKLFFLSSSALSFARRLLQFFFFFNAISIRYNSCIKIALDCDFRIIVCAVVAGKHFFFFNFLYNNIFMWSYTRLVFCLYLYMHVMMVVATAEQNMICNISQRKRKKKKKNIK